MAIVNDPAAPHEGTDRARICRPNPAMRAAASVAPNLIAISASVVATVAATITIEPTALCGHRAVLEDPGRDRQAVAALGRLTGHDVGDPAAQQQAREEDSRHLTGDARLAQPLRGEAADPRDRHDRGDVGQREQPVSWHAEIPPARRSCERGRSGSRRRRRAVAWSQKVVVLPHERCE